MTGFSDDIRGASSLEKMLGLLDVFTAAAPAWSTEDLIRFSGTSRSTCYRYIKTLQDAGFLTPVAGGAWMLGPRIIELDRTMRLCDPVTIGGGVPRNWAQEVGPYVDIANHRLGTAFKAPRYQYAVRIFIPVEDVTLQDLLHAVQKQVQAARAVGRGTSPDPIADKSP